MDSYNIALFLHLVTVMLAGAATAATKLAAGRCRAARTVGEVLEWHTMLMSAARLFPICLVIFVATGAYMAMIAHLDMWSTAFVGAGLVGVALLLISGTYLGVKAKGLKTVLEQVIAANGHDHPTPKVAPPRLVAILPSVNTYLAIAVMFVMVTKPATMTGALGIIALGMIVGAASAMRHAAPQNVRAGDALQARSDEAA